MAECEKASTSCAMSIDGSQGWHGQRYKSREHLLVILQECNCLLRACTKSCKVQSEAEIFGVAGSSYLEWEQMIGGYPISVLCAMGIMY